MENSSKALIIAGAILLSILIIAMGMFIYQKAQEQVNAAVSNLSNDEKNTHNSKFLNYEGKQSGSSVKQLINTLTTNAASTAAGENTEYKPGLQVPGGSVTKGQYTPADLNGLRKLIKDRAQYEVEVMIGAAGLVDNIVVRLAK